METSFIYERFDGPAGIGIELVYGGENHSPKLWKILARQIWTENAPEGAYRVIEHTEAGAPLQVSDLDSLCAQRISVSHTASVFAVASRETAGSTEEFQESAMLGVDLEAASRQQALKVRERYLSPEELALIPADDLTANVLAWTCKEALLKAGMDPKVDIREALRIERLPLPIAPGKSAGAADLGKGSVTADGHNYPLTLVTYRLRLATLRTPEYLLTLAY